MRVYIYIYIYTYIYLGVHIYIYTLFVCIKCYCTYNAVMWYGSSSKKDVNVYRTQPFLANVNDVLVWRRWRLLWRGPNNTGCRTRLTGPRFNVFSRVSGSWQWSRGSTCNDMRTACYYITLARSNIETPDLSLVSLLEMPVLSRFLCWELVSQFHQTLYLGSKLDPYGILRFVRSFLLALFLSRFVSSLFLVTTRGGASCLRRNCRSRTERNLIGTF